MSLQSSVRAKDQTTGYSLIRPMMMQFLNDYPIMPRDDREGQP